MSYSESPLLCQDSRAGEAHLIHWFTSYDRGKLIVVRDAETAATVLRGKVKEHPALVVVDALRIKFVAPNEVMQEEAAALVLQEDLRDFQHVLASKCELAENLGLSSLVPSFCKPCKDRLRQTEEEHYGCGKCFGGFVFEDIEKVYLEKGAAFRAAAGYLRNEDLASETRTVSKAEPLRPGARRYYVAVDRSGPHGDGVGIVAIRAPKKARRLKGRQGEYESCVLFRFEKLGQMKLDWLPAFQAEATAAADKEAEEARQTRVRSYDEKERESAIAALKSLL